MSWAGTTLGVTSNTWETHRHMRLTRDRVAGAKPLVADGRRACCSAHPCRAEGGAAPPAAGGEGPPLARLGAPVTKTEARVKLFSPAITLLAPQMLARYYPAFPAPCRSAGPPPRSVVTPPDDRRPPSHGSPQVNQSQSLHSSTLFTGKVSVPDILKVTNGRTNLDTVLLLTRYP